MLWCTERNAKKPLLFTILYEFFGDFSETVHNTELRFWLREVKIIQKKWSKSETNRTVLESVWLVEQLESMPIIDLWYTIWCMPASE